MWSAISHEGVLTESPAAIREVVVGAFGGWFVLAPFVVAMAVFVVAPYVAFERRFRDAWTRTRTRTSVVGSASPYRRARLVTGADPGAPWVVRAAALSSFFVGQAWLPLALVVVLVLIGADPVGLGVAVVLAPVAAVLARTWWAGARLLRPDVASQRAARNAARWLVHVSLPVALASLPLLAYLALRGDATPSDGLLLVVACAVTSCIGLGQAALVARATNIAASLLPPSDERDVRTTRPLPLWLDRLLARRR